VEVEVLDAYDPAKLGAVSMLLVRVRNTLGEGFKPVFFVASGGLAGYGAWDVLEGPSTISAGGEATFLLSPRYAPFSIPLGRSFRVLVFDAESHALKGRSRLVFIKPTELTWPRNPELGHWFYDMVEGVYVPFAWSFVSCREEAGEEARLAEVNGTAELTVAGLRRQRGDWLMAGLWQSVELPSTLKVRVKPMFSTPLSPRPSRLVGVEVGYGQWDWSCHRRVSNYTNLPYRAVWILFTNETEEPKLMGCGPCGHVALYFVPVKVGEWNEVEVNVTAILLSLGWPPPEPQPFTRHGPWMVEPQPYPYSWPQPYPYSYGDAAYVGRRVELTLFTAVYPWDPEPTLPKRAYFDLVEATTHGGVAS